MSGVGGGKLLEGILWKAVRSEDREWWILGIEGLSGKCHCFRFSHDGFRLPLSLGGGEQLRRDGFGLCIVKT